MQMQMFLAWISRLDFIQILVYFGLCPRGVFREGDLGVKTPLSTEIFFNLLGFFREKSQNTPSEKFWIHPCSSL